MRIDLHSHSVFSDGTDEPEQLVAAAVLAGLDVLALTDHDTFDGLPRAAAAASECGLELLGGIELSTKRNGRSVHVLGYGCDPDNADLNDELARVREGRRDRLPGTLDALARLGMPLTREQVAAQAQDAASLGRPHIADALVAAGYVRDRGEAFTKYLHDDGPAYVERYATPLERGIALIRGARGAAVLAHPWSRRGRHELPVAYLVELVTHHGLDGLEVDHPDHIPADRATLRALADAHGAIATGASDYHGHGKHADFRLGTCLTEPEQYARLRERLAERA